MGRLVAIGGGTFEEIDVLCRRICDLSGKEIPNVLFIGTALQDSTNPLTSCKKSFKRVCPGCIVKKLSIIRTSYTKEEIDALIAWADVIFVGGGNTAYMLSEWKKQGIDSRLKEVYEKDSAVISGISAGAICWFSLGYTDSAMFEGKADWKYEWIRPGFDFYDMAFCPHYNDWQRSGFDEALLHQKMSGVALEDCAAFIDDNGEYSFMKSKEDAHAWRFTFWDGEMKKEQVL